MTSILVTAGVFCIMAAIVGGGLTAFGIKSPVIGSKQRQILLAVTGVMLTILGVATGFLSTLASRPSSQHQPVSPPRTPINREALAAESRMNSDFIEKMQRLLAEADRKKRALQEECEAFDRVIRSEKESNDRADVTSEERAIALRQASDAESKVRECRSSIENSEATQNEEQTQIGKLEERNREITKELSQ
jgi:hypothetical protein